MSLTWTKDKGWVQKKRQESIGGRLPNNRRTSLTIHYIVDKSGYVTYFSTNAPGAFEPAWKNAGSSGNFQVNRSARTDRGLTNEANGLVDRMGATNQRDYAGVVEGYLLEHNNNEDANARANAINAAIGQEEAYNRRLNQQEQKVIEIADGTQGMDYLARRELIEKLGLHPSIKQNALDDFKLFYSEEKLRTWNGGKLGAYDPLGKFDGSFYLKENPELQKQWDEAKDKDDLDIVGRFQSASNLAHFDYTETGKDLGKRGSAIEDTRKVTLYSEKPPTDEEAQFLRKEQLGVGEDPVKTRDAFLKIPEIATQWERAKDGDSTTDGEHWIKLAAQQNLNLDDPDDFMMLFRLSSRDKDKTVNAAANEELGVSELDAEIYRIETDKVGKISQKFGALARDVLKETINKLNKAEARNARLDLINTIPEVQGLNNMASELANSIAGDYQAGGISPINKKELTKQFQNLFGTNNNVTYNWQKFFDEEIANKYKEGATLSDNNGQLIKIEKEFAKSYIDDFLRPRFDTSRSMDEFESYVGERQAERNPFDLQDFKQATRELATTQAEDFISQAQGETERYFNTDFYFDPVGRGDDEDYLNQKNRVESDWATAKDKPDDLINDVVDLTWAQAAYKYGIDLNDKQGFAKMHYQLIGQGEGFDGAEDIINKFKVNQKIEDISTALEAKDITAKFKNFETPEELADEVIKKLPTGDAERKERLSELGYGDFEGDDIQLRELLAFDAGKDEGLQIRRKLKYLQDEGELPTQQNLGFTYIEREEDIKPGKPGGRKVTAETPLFAAFQSAGYGGSEDDFYENFMTGTSKADQTLAYQISKGNPLTFSDNLERDIGAYSRLLDTPEERGARQKKEAKPYKSYFDTYEGDDYKKYTSKKGRSFLDEYKDLFDQGAFSFSSDF